MAKKNFQSAPKPQSTVSLEAIEAYEQDGVGHDGNKKIKSTSKPIQTRRLSIDLPEDTHLRFKTACSATRRKMTQEVEAFIIKRITELETEAQITRK